jgi:poly(A) polymerase
MQRLGQPPWMQAPATRAVIGALEAARPGGSRFVGGCVRNSLIGAPVDDVDIATTLAPQDVIAALSAAGLKHAPTGIAHGTVTAIAGGKGFEVTTLRRDVATDGRRAVVAYTDDWAEDASRRDFRLNALYAEPDGALHDPVGGLEDALAGRIVFIGDADARIAEDYLRILRLIRRASRLAPAAWRAWPGFRPSASGRSSRSSPPRPTLAPPSAPWRSAACSTR